MQHRKPTAAEQGKASSPGAGLDAGGIEFDNHGQAGNSNGDAGEDRIAARLALVEIMARVSDDITSKAISLYASQDFFTVRSILLMYVRKADNLSGN